MSTTDKCPHCGAVETRKRDGWSVYDCGSVEDFNHTNLCLERAAHAETRKQLDQVISQRDFWEKRCDEKAGELNATKRKLSDAISDAASWQKQADDRLNDALEFGRRAEKAEARVKELEAREPKWCPDRCPITFRPFFMWLDHPEKGLVPTYGGPYDSYTIPEPEMPEDGKKTAFHDIELHCERYDHDEGAWVDGSEDPGHRAIIQDRLVELEEFNALMERVKELEGLDIRNYTPRVEGVWLEVFIHSKMLCRNLGGEVASKTLVSTLGDAMPRKDQ